MNTKVFRDGDILVSESKSIISMVKGEYKDGEFRSYVDLDEEGLHIRTYGVWDDITDWRLANKKERSRLRKSILTRKSIIKEDLKTIDSLLEKI
ncbi:hypothetical protein [Parabacteroides sp.]